MLDTYDTQIMRQWEVNTYNDLGFLCNGYSIQETDHGHKNENREATDLEISLWEKFSQKTPKFPCIQVSDDIDLTDVFVKNDEFIHTLENQSLEGSFVWIENKFNLVLFHKKDTSWFNGIWTKEWRQPFSIAKDFRTL